MNSDQQLIDASKKGANIHVDNDHTLRYARCVVMLEKKLMEQ